MRVEGRISGNVPAMSNGRATVLDRRTGLGAGASGGRLRRDGPIADNGLDAEARTS